MTFYCISYYEGDISWVCNLKKNQYIIYKKNNKDINQNFNVIEEPNVGYNIYSYLNFIIDNYDNLPNVIIFCKNNIVERHVGERVFKEIDKWKTFSAIEDPKKNKYSCPPQSFLCGDGGFLEVNNSWYKTYFERRYFTDFNDFYNYIFEVDLTPDYLRFAPGANYVVPRENIKIRSKSFYENLYNFVNYSQLPCEAHFIERALMIIWGANNIKESNKMQSKIDSFELQRLRMRCEASIKKENKTLFKLSNKLKLIFR